MAAISFGSISERTSAARRPGLETGALSLGPLRVSCFLNEVFNGKFVFFAKPRAAAVGLPSLKPIWWRARRPVPELHAVSLDSSDQDCQTARGYELLGKLPSVLHATCFRPAGTRSFEASSSRPRSIILAGISSVPISSRKSGIRPLLPSGASLLHRRSVAPHKPWPIPQPIARMRAITPTRSVTEMAPRASSKLKRCEHFRHSS